MQMSRSAPPQVPPVVHNGIRYEQIMNGLRQGLPMRNGYLSATKIDSGDRLWIVQVYKIAYDSALEQDVQDVYFAQTTLLADKNQLLIENETKQRFLVNLADHTVTPAP